MKTLKKIFFFIIVFTLLSAVAGYFIATVYEDEVKDIFVRELNRKLNTGIRVGEIELTLMRKFPDASLLLNNVVLFSNDDTTDIAMMSAESVFLHFNLIDFFHGNYHIKKIQIEDAEVHLSIDSEGGDNFHFLRIKEDEPEDENKPFAFRLEDIAFQNTKIIFINKKEDVHLSFYAGRITLNGDFTNENYTLHAGWELKEFQLIIKKEKYADKLPLKGALVLDINKESYTIKSGNIASERVAFDVAGELEVKRKEGHSKRKYSLKFTGKELEVENILKLIPSIYLEKIKHFHPKGIVDISATVAGNEGAAEVSAKFGVSHAVVHHDSTGVDLSDVAFDGILNWNEKNNGSVSLKDISAVFLGDTIYGDLSIVNFNKPKYTLSAAATLNAATLFKNGIIKHNDLEEMSGFIAVRLNRSGKLKSISDYTLQDITSDDFSATMDLINVNFSMKNNVAGIIGLNGRFILNNNNILMQQVKGQYLKSDFNIDGDLKNCIPWLFSEKESIQISAEISSDKMDLGEILHDNSVSGESEKPYSVIFPDNAGLDLSLHIGEVVFRRFHATQISGNVKVKDRKIIAKGLLLHTMGGTLSGDALIDASGETQILISCDAVVKRIDISKTFYSFEDFGQDVISHQNMKGIATAQIQVVSLWSNQLNADLNRLYTKADITIEKGELINYEPLMALSEHIEVDELKHIRFSKLQNNIEIKDGKVHIPKMEIRSSALNLLLSGTHSFNNEIDYRFRIYLPELQAKKARKAKKENNEFGVVADDGTGMHLFLSMTGTSDNPVVQYDKKGFVEKIKEDIKEEKQTLKTILNKEFGWFKKDTIISKEDKKKDKFTDDYFLIEWEDDK